MVKQMVKNYKIINLFMNKNYNFENIKWVL